MRTKLLVLTIIWIVAGVLSLPIIYLLGAFSTDNATSQQHFVVVGILLFYLQLVIQSIVAIISLKRIGFLGRYLFALLLILLPPFVLLPIGLNVGMHFVAEPVLWATLYGTLAFQLFGSVWMWVLIGTASKQPLTPAQPPTVAQQSLVITQPSSDTLQGAVAVPAAIQTTTLRASISRKSRRKLGFTILLTPILLFILGIALMAITMKINPEYYTLSLAKSLPVGRAADFTAHLAGMLFLPCVIAGTVLISRSRAK